MTDDKIGNDMSGPEIDVEMTCPVIGVEMTGPVIGVEMPDPVTGAEMTGPVTGAEMTSPGIGVRSLDWGWDDRAGETRPGDWSDSEESRPEEEESSLNTWSDDLLILLSADMLVVEPPIGSTGVTSVEREVSVRRFSRFSR